MDLRKTFSERLSALRKEKGISLASLGEQLSVTDEAVRLLEKGKRSPSFELLCALAEYFGVSVDYLVGATDNPHQEIDTVRVITKKPHFIQDALGIPHKEYPNDFSVEVRGNIPPDAYDELEKFIAYLKEKYVF